MVEPLEWSDRMGPRRRQAWLLLIKDDRVHVFGGKDIPGVCVVIGTDYTQEGKWSHTTYRLVLGKGVRHIAGREGWETARFTEGLGEALGKRTPDTWTQVAELLGVSVPSTMELLRNWRPGAAKKLDEVDAALADLEEAAEETVDDPNAVIVTVSFGGASHRGCREGYWETPKPIPGFQAEIRRKEGGDWNNPDDVYVVGIEGRVLRAHHVSGMRSGYSVVTVAVVPGTETPIPPFETSRERLARETGLPFALVHAFDCDLERVRAFMAKVDALNVEELDPHEITCGRARRRAEVERVARDRDFFLGADPLEVWPYIREKIELGDAVRNHVAEDVPSPMAEALRHAGLIEQG